MSSCITKLLHGSSSTRADTTQLNYLYNEFPILPSENVFAMQQPDSPSGDHINRSMQSQSEETVEEWSRLNYARASDSTSTSLRDVSEIYQKSSENLVERYEETYDKPVLGYSYLKLSMQIFLMTRSYTWMEGRGRDPMPELLKLFHNALDEIFEDGMNSAFGTCLNRIVSEYGESAVDALERITRMDDVSIGVVEEALREIGYMEDESTHSCRLSLLEHTLESSNTRIRDAASIGIAAMNDPAARESIKRAIKNEPYEQLRQNFRNVLEHL